MVNPNSYFERRRKISSFVFYSSSNVFIGDSLCKLSFPKSFIGNPEETVIPEIHKNVIPEILYRGSGPIFLNYIDSHFHGNDIITLDSRFRGNDKETAGMTRKVREWQEKIIGMTRKSSEWQEKSREWRKENMRITRDNKILREQNTNTLPQEDWVSVGDPSSLRRCSSGWLARIIPDILSFVSTIIKKAEMTEKVWELSRNGKVYKLWVE